MTRPAALSLILLALAGCTRLGTPLEHAPLPPGAPDVKEILADLAANDRAVGDFKATGRVIVRTPELEAVHKLTQSEINFRRPSDLYVVGRKYGTNFLELTCEDDRFLMNLPSEKQYYYSEGGETVDQVSFKVTPVDIAREMFLPERWSEVAPARVRITGYDAETRHAELEVESEGRNRYVRRKVIVAGPPWHAVASERLERGGHVIAVTQWRDYQSRDGVYFPTEIEAEFPGQDAHMLIGLRRFQANRVPDPADFDVKRKLAEVRRKGYEQLEREERAETGP